MKIEEWHKEEMKIINDLRKIKMIANNYGLEIQYRKHIDKVLKQCFDDILDRGAE